MLNQDDEEYKKRLEEAKRLRMSTGMITTSDYNSNNNSFAQTTDDDYQARLQEAKRLRNSVGMITSDDIETDNDRIKNKMNAVWNDTNNMYQNNIEDKTSTSQINDKYGLGNIDLTNRQVVKNQDGSISTVRSISFQDDSGKEILIPTVVNGKIVSNDEAIQHYYKTGEYLGKFDTVEQANAYAEQLHKQQDSLYNVNSNQVSTLSVTPIRNTAKNAITSNTENSKRIVSAVDTNILNKKLNEQYQNKNKNIFSFAKDLIASTVISAYSTIKGLGETIKENGKERIEMLNNMSDDEIKNLANYQYNANDITKRLITQPLKGDSTSDENKKSSISSNLARTKLYIEDLAQDVSRSSVNGLIGTINNVIDFFTAGKKKDMLTKVDDWSILNNSEKYGDYTSQEALSQHIQDDKKNLYLNTGTYNPVANNIGSAVVNVATTVLLSKVGLGDTTSFVTSSALQSLGDTGSVEEATKSALSSYVFSKVLDSKIADDVSQKIYNGSEKITRRISKINPELFDSGIKKAILDSFPSVSKTFSKVFVGKTVAGEVNSIMDKGSETYSSDSQVGILADALIFSTIYAGINGYGGVKYRLKAEKLSQNEAQNQVSQWYKTMGLDEDKKYYSPDEMKKIYRNLAKKYHSDVTGGSDEVMANINIAYDGLVRYFNEGNVYKFGIETEPVKTESKASNSASATSNTGLITIGDNEGYINTKDVMQTTLKNIAMSQIEDGIVVNKDNENRVSNFEKVKTIPFEVEGSKLPDIASAVTIDEQGTIGIIDINSGTKLLDNVQDIGTAMKQTGDMLKSNDEGVIKRIEDEVWTTKFEAEQGIDQILGVIQNKAEEFKSTSGTNEIEQSANLKASTSNYTNKANNLVESQGSQNANALNMEDRTYSNVGNKNIKPYSEEHPEISQDIKDMAANFMEDLANSLPGKRYKAGDAWTGQKRSTTKELADFKDATGISWDKIGDVLNDIYEGKGNYALAKKMEIKLDQALSKGYRNIYGQTIMPNEEYLQKKGKIEGKDYLTIKDSGDVTDYTDSDFTLFMKKKANRKVAKNPNIEYNENGIWLNESEYARVMSEISTNKPLAEGIQDINTADYFYIYYNSKFANNKIIFRAKIDGNEDLINSLRREIENGTIEGTETISSTLQALRNVREPYNSNDVGNSETRASQQTNRLYNREERQRGRVEQRRSSKESIGNKSNLKNSNENESSFSMPQNEDIRYLKKTDKNSPVDEDIQKELHNRIQNALLSKNSRKNTFLGTVSEKVAKKVKSLLGLDVSGRKHMLSDYDIRHIIKQHGNPEIEKSKGQIAITFEDIEKIPDIINNYDDLTKGSPNKNVFTKQMQDSIRYSKQYENNILYVVEVVPDESGVLNVKTMWKKPIETNKKNNSVSVSHDNNIALPYTSETKPNSSYSKDSISQNTENVNQESAPKEFDLEKSKTNIQREDSFIEQEIQKAIKNNDIDENIPLTKISDIVYDIEKYIGSDIELKHFRGRAYGIYKTNRDLIRVAEKSDLDTILHEFAHQLDYRLHLDKSELYSEIVTDKIQEDYANAPDDVQLDEGFAEVIRQYFTQPDIVEKEFPDTVKKINELRNNDKELDEFITKTQKKIYNYIHQTPEKRAKSNISFKEDSKISINDFKTKVIEKAITLVYDEDYALKKYTKLLYDIAGYPEARQISASQDPVIASRLRKGLAGAVDDMVKNGIIDLNTGERKSQGLSAIEDILKDENMTDFMNYLVSLRSIEVAEKELKSGIRYDDAKAVVEKYKKNKSFEKARKVIEQYNNALLDYAKDAGLYSKEDIDLIKQSWLTYVPFQRVIDNGTGKSQRTTGNPLKTFRGSDREIINPLEGIIMNTVKIVDASSKNEVIRRFYNLGEEAQYTAGIYDVIPPPVKNVATEKLSDFKGYLAKQGVELSDEQLEKAYKIFYPDTRDNPNQLITSFMNNGERIYLQFKDKNLYKIFTGMNRQEMNLLQKYVGFANSIFKAGTTGYNLAFAIPNILSDTQQAFVTSEANFIPLYSSIKGVYDTLVARGVFKSGTDDGQKMQKIYSLYLQSGASGAGRTSTYRKDIEQQLVDIYKKKYKDFGLKQSSIEQFKEIAGYVSEISEEATRFENFVLELKKNLTNKMSYRNAVESAAVSTRRLTQDFAIKGSLSKQINAFVPYFSARRGGYYNAYEKYESTLRNAQNKYWEVYNKNLEGKSEEELKNPETFEKAKEEADKAKMKIIAKPLLAILAILAYNTVRKAVVKGDKNIEELTEQKKMDNYVFPNPFNANEVITIRKPQGVLKDIINSAEFVQDLVTGNIEEEKVGDKFVSLISSILKNNSGVDDFSGLIPPIIKVPLEIATNKDWYFNSEIVKDNDLQNLKPEDQYYEYNTNLSIKLGKILKKSPAQIDFSIRNIFGQASYDLWSGFSSVFDFFEGNQKADMGASDKFILKRFFANPNNNSESVTDLYNKQDELTVKKNYNEITPEESKQLENIQDATSIISNINKKIKAIKNNSNLSSKEKGEQIYELQQQRTDTARQALGKDLISSSSDEIESSGFYPRTSTLSSNGYSLTLTNEMKTEYEKLAYESYQKYSKQNIYSSEYLQKIKQNCKNYAKQVLMKKYQNKLVKSK